MTFWNDIRVDILESEWEAGTPAKDIGVIIGATKNAVIGKAWRMGLEPRNPYKNCGATPLSEREWTIRMSTIRSMREAGCSSKEIGAILGLCSGYVTQIERERRT